MRKYFTLLMITVLSLPVVLHAQDAEKKALKVELHGFVNYEMTYDTRMMVAAREGNVMLFPTNESLDINGNDINAKGNFNFMSINSRLQAKVTGPDAFGAKTSAVIEGDFFGTGNSFTGLVRLRHAFVKFDWGKTQVVAGHTWHPMFVVECFPGVVGFGGSIPFHVLSRAPQLRVNHKVGDLRLSLIALTQRDFSSRGPNGVSSEYVRNSGVPEVDAQLLYSKDDFLIGATAGYKTMQPRLATTTGVKTDATIGSYQANAFVKYKFKPLTVSVQYITGQNMANFFMIGGYGATAITQDGAAVETYTNTTSSSVWADMQTNGKKVKAGLFVGYLKNSGADKAILADNMYGFGNNIASAYRIAPRLVFTSGRVDVGLEVFYDGVEYGKNDEKFNVIDTKTVNGTRFLAGVKYKF